MDAVEILDVTPRDGLQDADAYVPVADKAALIRGLIDAGVRAVEVASFVHPKWVPMLQDSDILVPQLRGINGRWVALVPNQRGLDRAKAAGLDTITVVASASESHNKANLNRSRDETLTALAEVVQNAHQSGMTVRGGISTAFTCPFEGDVPLQDVMKMAEAYLSMGVDHVNIADTLGTATPHMVKERIHALNTVRADTPLSLHLHDRYGWALANIAMAYEHEVREFETALGGLGGCPYAPGAAGNLDTEKLVQFFEAQGISTGIDTEQLHVVRDRLFGVLSKGLQPAQ